MCVCVCVCVHVCVHATSLAYVSLSVVRRGWLVQFCH